jgi:hypothetical protein
MNRVIDEFTREEYELLYSAFKSFRVYMNDAEEVIAEQILDKVFYPSFDAQERTEDLKASQEFRSEVDELVADAEEALANEPEINGIKSLNFR